MNKKPVTRKASDAEVYETLSDATIFADLFNGAVFGGEQILNAGMLSPCNEKKQQIVRGRKKHSVILKRIRDNQKIAQFPDGQLAVILASENQRLVHYAMPVRNMMYDCMDYADQIKNYVKKHRDKKDLKAGAEFLSGLKKDEKLMPVLTIVFYYGEEAWDGPGCLHDMIDFPEKLLPLKEYFPNYKLNLVSSATVDYHNFKTGLCEVFELLSVADSKERMKEFLAQHEEHYGHLDGETCDLITKFLDIPVLEKKRSELTAEGEVDMCTAIREMIEEGRQEGRQEGEVYSSIIILRKLYQKNFQLNEIAELLEMPIQMVMKAVELISQAVPISNKEIADRVIKFRETSVKNF